MTQVFFNTHSRAASLSVGPSLCRSSRPLADPASPVVALSDSQLQSAQQMARHLSSVMALSQRGAARPPLGSLVAAPLREGSAEGSSELLSPVAGPAAAAAAAAAEAGPASNGGKAQVGGGDSLGGTPAGSAAERLRWAQGKLVALVDAVHQLEADAYEERQRDANAGAQSRGGGGPAGCWGNGGGRAGRGDAGAAGTLAHDQGQLRHRWSANARLTAVLHSLVMQWVWRPSCWSCTLWSTPRGSAAPCSQPWTRSTARSCTPISKHAARPARCGSRWACRKRSVAAAAELPALHAALNWCRPSLPLLFFNPSSISVGEGGVGPAP